MGSGATCTRGGACARVLAALGSGDGGAGGTAVAMTGDAGSKGTAFIGCGTGTVARMTTVAATGAPAAVVHSAATSSCRVTPSRLARRVTHPGRIGGIWMVTIR